MPAATLVDVVNRALLLISANTITSLDEESTEAEKINIILDPVIDEVMAMYKWPFAKKRAALTLVDVAPAFGYLYQYELPEDYNAVVEIFPRNTEYTTEAFQDKRVLLTNATAVNLVYASNTLNISKTDGLFRYILTLKIAAAVESGLKNKEDQAPRFLREAEYKIAQAKQIYSRNHTAETLVPRDLSNGRHVSTNLYDRTLS